LKVAQVGPYNARATQEKRSSSIFDCIVFRLPHDPMRTVMDQCRDRLPDPGKDGDYLAIDVGDGNQGEYHIKGIKGLHVVVVTVDDEWKCMC
ncbi:hypothetical protein THAOC_04510, partial [Thalassiosira oceanica]